MEVRNEKGKKTDSYAFDSVLGFLLQKFLRIAYGRTETEGEEEEEGMRGGGGGGGGGVYELRS